MGESCKCGKYKKCIAEDSLIIDAKGQVKINSLDWFKCYDFKNQMKCALRFKR